jgi:hypothetical protein
MKLMANGTVDIEAMGTLQDEFQFLVQKTSLEVGPILSGTRTKGAVREGHAIDTLPV